METKPGGIRVLLFEEQTLVRECLKHFLTTQEGILEVGSCGSPGEALSAVAGGVDVLLIPARIFKARTWAFLNELSQGNHRPRLLVLDDDDIHEGQVVELFRRGISGVLSTRGTPEQLVSAIWAVASGASWVEPRHVTALVHAIAPAREKPFTDREYIVIRSVVEGASNKLIGSRLGMSESAVKATLQQIFRKTNVRTRAQLVRVALERNFTDNTQ